MGGVTEGVIGLRPVLSALSLMIGRAAQAQTAGPYRRNPCDEDTMTLLNTLRALFTAATLTLLALPAAAHEGVHIIDPYARVIAGNGVIYFGINNHSASPDRLISAQTDSADMTMLMNSHADADGVMRMQMIDGGMVIDGEGSRFLGNAADHVMLQGVHQPLKTGDIITLTLTFEHAGVVVVQVPVDNARRTDPGMGPTPYDVMSGPPAP